MTLLRQIHGQDRAVGLIRAATATGKVPHAWLFAGPAGTGKATTARALAHALNCEIEPGEGCGRCEPCTKIAGGSHPDVLTLRPEGAGNFIVVAVIRDLVARLAYPPNEGRARVIIVEDAERLKVEAANAFLKTLEEPPARTHFVLVTAAPDQLLQTVRSRCQRVRFGPLGEGAVATILETTGVPRERARQVAALSGGSATRGLQLADGEALERRREHAARLRRAAHETTWKPVFEAASSLAQDKADVAPALELLAIWYRDAAALAAGVGEHDLVHRDQVDDLRAEVAMARGPARLARSAAAVLKAQSALLGFANPQLTLERLIVALREG